MDINPTGHSKISSRILNNIYPTTLLNNQIKSTGIDERYPVGLYNPDKDDLYKIIRITDSFEKLEMIQKKIQKKVFIEDIEKDELINEILKTNNIQRYNIKSGGLFDDWERNI